MLENRKVEKQLKEEAKRNEFVNQVAPKKVEESKTVDEEIQDIAVRGTVLCELLNVRKEPNINAEVVTVLPQDSIVTISDTHATEDFYKVLVGDVEGYCMKKFMAIVAE